MNARPEVTGRKLHLDKRAHKIVEQSTGDPDELLTGREVSDWLGVSMQWLEIGRCQDYGPPFVRVGPRVIRYRRDDVLKWLKARTHSSTAEYASPATAA